MKRDPIFISVEQVLEMHDQSIKEHGGKIELETEVGRGTTFTILLPERLPPTPARPSPGSTSRPTNGSPGWSR